jgi:hypothetical protein
MERNSPGNDVIAETSFRCVAGPALGGRPVQTSLAARFILNSAVEASARRSGERHQADSASIAEFRFSGAARHCRRIEMIATLERYLPGEAL